MIQLVKRSLYNNWVILTGGKYVPLYFFMHIPKTAGTSFRHMLMKKFADEDIIPNPQDQVSKEYRYVDIPSFIGENPNRKRHTRLIVGHTQYGTEEIFNRKKVFRLTLLRSPVERSISTLKQHHRRYTELIDWPLEDIMDKYKERFWNRQTTLFTRDQVDLPEEDRLELAIERMQKFEFVGITEHFSESIQLLEQQTGWTFPRVIRKNTSKKPLEIPSRVMDKIKAWNRLDDQLYRAGVQRLQQQIPSMTGSS